MIIFADIAPPPSISQTSEAANQEITPAGWAMMAVMTLVVIGTMIFKHRWQRRRAERR